MVVSERSVAEWEARLGVDVRRVRNAAELTQVELADRANVALSALKNLEGGHGCTLTTVVRVAHALDRTDWLGGFAPAAASVSPMDLLRQRQRVDGPKKSARGGLK